MQNKVCGHIIAIKDVKDYFKVTSCRVGRTGGGVALLIHKSIESFEIIDSYQDNFFNFLLVKVKHLSQEFVINVVYNPPTSNIAKSELFLNLLDRYLTKHKYKHIILIGDFNLDLLNVNRITSDYLNVLKTNNFHICDSYTPTRPVSGTVLDHVAVNSLNLDVVVNHIDYCISDHNIMVCEFITEAAVTINVNNNKPDDNSIRTSGLL